MSWAWSWFTKDKPRPGRAFCEVPIVNSEGETVACGRDVGFSGGSTSGMLRHIESTHKDINAGQLRKEATGPMDKHLGRKPRLLDAYVEWILETYQPIDTCVHPKFRKMIETARSTSKEMDWFGRTAVVKRMREMEIWTAERLPQASLQTLLLNLIVKIETIRLALILFWISITVDKTMQVFKGQTVAITTDAWTSAANSAFTGYHVSYIDEQWLLQTLSLGISPFPGKHTADMIAEDAVKNLAKAGMAVSQVCGSSRSFRRFAFPPASLYATPCFWCNCRCLPSSLTRRRTWLLPERYLRTTTTCRGMVALRTCWSSSLACFSRPPSSRSYCRRRESS